MKKLILTSLIALMVISPLAAFAGDIYWNASATFHNDAKFTKPKLPGAKGTANITCVETDGGHEWSVTLKFSGLLEEYDYVFQFGIQDQLLNRYDHTIKTDGKGKIDTEFKITNLDSFIDNDTQYLPKEHNPQPVYRGYTILRLLDLEGKSGGKLLTPDLEPNNELPNDNPYCVCLDPDSPDCCEYPDATMVMRARQDGIYGRLQFVQP